MVAMPAHLRPHQMQELMQDYLRLTKTEGYGVKEACALMAEPWKKTPEAIYRIVRRFLPTHDLAEQYLKASALTLAMRVVKRGNVDQAIEVLSRPNLGVLAPAKTESAGGAGFFISVNMGDLGAVQVQSAPEPLALQKSGSTTSPVASPRGQIGEGHVIDYNPSPTPPPREKKVKVEAGKPHPTQATYKSKGVSKRAQEFIDAHKRKLSRERSVKQKSRNRGIVKIGPKSPQIDSE